MTETNQLNTLKSPDSQNFEFPEQDLLSRWFESNMPSMIATAQKIFTHPELPYEEHISSHILGDYAVSLGFEVSYGIADIDTAFVASYGSGKPILGFLAEYDALPHLGQQPCPNHAPIDGPGHGCGHNLLGTAVTGAAAAVKSYIEKTHCSGTVLIYGCPAEENMSGKIVMNKKHVFDNLDIAITWHPFDQNRISNDIWLAQDVKNYKFHGTAAHAAKFPELGRSALDAAELMNVGVNYLREHVKDDVRMHYAYTSANAPANVVPDYVETNYFIRSGLRARTDDASKRVDNCAKGAALMTGTQVDIELVTSCQEMKVNRVLMEHYYEAMKFIDAPTYTAEELNFAEHISKEGGLIRPSTEGSNRGLFDGLYPLEDQPSILSIGTDVSDVSHTVPTITISAATMCKGTPLHHWTTTAQSGMSIGHKGMMYAAKCMALGTVSLITNTQVLKKAWEEHKQTP